MSDRKIDTAALLSKIDIVKVIGEHVQLGKSGAEFEACCPFHNERTPSFKVNQVKQIYHCFGCGANGDAIKFLQDYQGLTFIEACRALGADVPESGAQATVTPRAAVQREPLHEKQQKTVWQPMLPVPPHATELPKAHTHRGHPERTWCYRDASGNALGYVFRFKKSDGGKETLPLVWARNPDNGREDWRWLSFPEPRPLYGLDRLAAKPDATVLLVEGEKCADAAHEQLPDLAVVSWPGGGKAVGKADWLPLYGRRVVMWADCDAKRERLTPAEKEAGVDPMSKPLLAESEQPGVKAMAQIAGMLADGGGKLWTVAIPAPGEKPDGWDVADAIEEGLVGDALADFIRGNSRPVAPASEGGEMPSEGASTPPGAAAGGGDDAPPSWRTMLLRKDDRLIDCRENVYLMLRHHPAWDGVIGADAFAKRVMKRKPTPWGGQVGEWEETDTLRLGMWLAQEERLLVRSSENIAAAVNWCAADQQFHPVMDYLESLHWDGVSRLDDWLTDYLGVRRTEYVMLVGRFFLVSMVARIYRPGCVVRAMPIFEGGQFQGKSTALRILGGPWFGDTTLDLNNKDAYQLIQGCWLYEVAELDAFNRAETTRIKSFISSTKDRFRAPYERAPRDWLRQTVFGGSTNQDEYFKDQTGNTRYWPLRVMEEGPIELDKLSAMRDQLFAEAVVCFKRGDRWHPTQDEQRRLFEPEQDEREIMDLWEPIIRRYLKGLTQRQVTATDIIQDCLKIDAGKIDGTRSMSTRIGVVMKRLGWHKKRSSSGSREYYYERPRGWDGVEGNQERQDGPGF